MKKLITICLLFLTGLMQAQTFDFGCVDPDEINYDDFTITATYHTSLLGVIYSITTDEDISFTVTENDDDEHIEQDTDGFVIGTLYGNEKVRSQQH